MQAGWRVVKAAFEVSAPDVSHAPLPGPAELAIAGRSNVGKSSLINAVCGVRGLARVSGTPGRTRLLNFFRVELRKGDVARDVRVVDLPGYGYAAAPSAVRHTFAPMVGGYFADRAVLQALVLLIDVRRGVGELDKEMLGLATGREIPTLLVATKVDKLGAAERGLARGRLAEAVGAQPQDVAMTSATSGLGLDDLASDLADLLEPA